jgi:hypothetical protein
MYVYIYTYRSIILHLLSETLLLVPSYDLINVKDHVDKQWGRKTKWKSMCMCIYRGRGEWNKYFSEGSTGSERLVQAPYLRV